MAKEGSTIAGLMECFGTVVSVSLQHGVPLKVLCDKLSHTRFEPSDWTGNEELGYAKSIADYLFRWMQLRFLSDKQLPLFTQRMAVVERQGSSEANHAPAGVSQYLHDSYEVADAPLCVTCGSLIRLFGEAPQSVALNHSGEIHLGLAERMRLAEERLRRLTIPSIHPS
jgi:ribonucleoside-diphosphate reductase alpha chain